MSILFLSTALMGCYEENKFPDTPSIAFESIEFVDSSNDVDSLKLTFSFEDGDANIGFNESRDIFFPYNQYLVFLDINDSIVTRSNFENIQGQLYLAQLITKNISLRINEGKVFYSLSEENNHAVLAFDKQLYDGSYMEIGDEITQEDFVCPNVFNQLLDGFRVYGSSSAIGLSVYTQDRNLLNSYNQRIDDDILVIPVTSYHNIFIHIEQQTLDGGFERVDFQNIFQTDHCLFGNFNGRIPLFAQDGERGSITYSIISRGLSIAFQDNLLRMKFSVLDRAGNRSNEVITPTFKLSEITQ